jgi:hypothetical protein
MLVYNGTKKKLTKRPTIVGNPYMAVSPANFLNILNGHGFGGQK